MYWARIMKARKTQEEERGVLKKRISQQRVSEVAVALIQHRVCEVRFGLFAPPLAPRCRCHSRNLRNWRNA
jgi:hypothetical protein